MQRITCILFLLFISLIPLRAGEGIWLPHLLKQLNEAEMQSMGMKMSAEDIYSVNQGSLKDAIVSFGGYCTGEVISDQGLLLTNFHCGRSPIQSNSTMQNNYLEDGYWAKSQAEELPNPGLFATFIVRIDDVTEAALAGVEEDMYDNQRQSVIDQNLRRIQSEVKKEDYQGVLIRPFFEGNQYFLFVTETYRDVRLVGNPPASIGEFGKDTDNWVWPRHCADFSLFRIYAGPDNKPAEYSPENKPLQPRHFLPVSLDGIEAGDFTLVFGFPGRTDQYLPSPAIQQRVEVLNPARIEVRQQALSVIDAAMRADPVVKLQYASKQSRIANSWKKWIGESQGVARTGGLERKKAFEQEFISRLKTNPVWEEKYGGLLPEFIQLYRELEPYALTNAYVSEIAGRNIELFRLINVLHQYIRIYENNGAEALRMRQDRLAGYLESFFEDYRPEIDKGVMTNLLELYFNKVNADHLSPFAVEQVTKMAEKDYGRYAELVFEQSSLDDPGYLSSLVRQDVVEAVKAITEDYAYQLCRSILETNDEKVMPTYDKIEKRLSVLQRRYMQALMEVFPDKRFYPDANSTLRVTYGTVDGYQPRDAVRYEPVTYLDGVMEKYVPGDYEFNVPEKLRKLYETKDYGPYSDSGRMPVCFIGTNHTSGGNSGSPAIDAYGNLVGLNFDRVWEGTMSDINYDASICRNIMVDIRYVLFIIDKFGDAGWLVEEMKLVHPKS